MMRQMKSPGPAQSTSSSTLPPATCSTPSSSVPLHNACFSLSSATANFLPHASAASTPSSAAASSNDVVTPTQPATPAPSNVESSLPDGPHPNTPKLTCLTEMQAENFSLRTHVGELRKQLHDVLDHTIKSDRRMLNFTDELFVVNPSRNETSSTSSSVSETLPTEPSEQRSSECKNRQCTEVRDLVNNLKTTIEVLEAEIELLKSGNSSCTLTVEGDSHVRSLTGLVQSLVTAETSVLGMCKLGAGLLGVVEGVPYRHDLSTDHPVNKQTDLVNHYIRELCARCEGSVLLDFNTIGRRHFTRHGQHLTMGGKQLLARLVVDGLRRVSYVSVGRTQPPPSLPLPSPAAPAGSPSIATAAPRQLRRCSKIFTSKYTSCI
ncbi:hypothetical protein J6590_079138 [Homalodisca vitripennis]|nr:hypothetical protein J6590_079138 [Homalodisca vitripennis]